jgi:hypothetical protein
MRTISAAGLSELAKNLGTEPVIILDIQWTDDGSIYSYGDVDSPGVKGIIQSVSGLDNIITISGVTQATTGESAQISVVLSDISGDLKDILDQNDIHKRPCWVYQWFPNLDLSDRFLLFKGLISSPLEWHEGDRTVHFDVINQIEDAEVGFSVEEGNIPNASDYLIGKAWPLVFGTCVHVPALQIGSGFSGTLRKGFGIHDYTLGCKLDQIRNLCCPLQFTGFRTRFVGDPSLPSLEIVPVFVPEPGCVCRTNGLIADWTADIALQKSFEFGELDIIGGNLFPQNQLITLKICGSEVLGKFNGDTFAVQKYTHPQKIEGVVCPKTIFFRDCGKEGDPVTNTEPTSTGAAICVGSSPKTDRTGLGWDYLASFPTADFFWAEPGCEVTLKTVEGIIYIVNLLPSTILRVAAYRTFEGGHRELVTVPATYYTSRISDFNGYLVTELLFDQELSRRGEGWEDDVYVSQTSSVGPNTVDILEWLIQKYTSLSIDSTSFDDVRTKIDNYPSSFPLLERRNILEVLKEIAFQARCALYLRNDVFHIRYLSEEPDSDFDITENDVLPKSLIFTHTSTEDLVTKLVANWRDDYAIEDGNTVILRYNIRRYGTQEEKFDFYIYNIRELVEKSATFWLIRMANTWRKIKCRTPLTKLQSEVFDIATITLPDFSGTDIKTIVEQATYDSDSHEIEFELWTPVRAGETEPFIFAWPAQIEVHNFWATDDDLDAGGTPNSDVEAPETHALSINSGLAQGFQLETRQSGRGDLKPSDKDDVKPVKQVQGQGENDIPSSKNPLGRPTRETIDRNSTPLKEEANEANSVAQNEKSRNGGDDKENDPLKTLPCDETGACRVTVKWKTHLVNSVQEGITIKDQCGDTGDLSSFPIPSDITEHSVTFDSKSAAQAAYQRILADYFSVNTVCEYHTAPGTASIVGESAWDFNMCEEPEEPSVVSFCGDADKLGSSPILGT